MRKIALFLILSILLISLIVGLNQIEKTTETHKNPEKMNINNITYENVGNTTEYNCEKLQLIKHNQTHCKHPQK